MRILIAEDEKDLNRVIARKLREDGYLVDTAFDGGEALDYHGFARAYRAAMRQKSALAIGPRKLKQ